MVKINFGRRRSSGRGNPYSGIIFGLVFFGGASAGLFFGEWQGANRSVSLNEAKRSAKTIETASVNQDNEGKLVHLYGDLKSDAMLKDKLFSVSSDNTIHLKRKVEMFQWVETERRSSSSSSSSSRTTYSYDMEWSERYHNSNHFHRSGYDNPPMPIKSKTWSAKKVTLDAFSLSSKLIKQFKKYKPISISPKLFEKMPQQAKNKYVLSNNILKNKNHGSQPNLGDLRISFLEAKPAAATILAMQSGDTFKAYPTRGGKDELEQTLSPGTVTLDEMFKEKASDNVQTTWIVRLFSFIFALVGMSVMMSSMNKLSEKMSFLKPLAGGQWFPRAALLALATYTLIITINWLGKGPTGTISLVLLVICIVGLAFLIMNATKDDGIDWDDDNYENQVQYDDDYHTQNTNTGASADSYAIGDDDGIVRER